MSRPVRRLARCGALQAWGCLLAAITLGAAVGGAQAETAIPAQATADGGAFLPYAPAPPQRGGLCLVDTGASVNRDTEGAVVDRSAIDGGSGEDVSPEGHGTVLAMMAAAPANGWGMLGVAPGAVQIVSVRVLEPGQRAFPFVAYAAGITACLELRQKYDIRAINLSLGNRETPSVQDYEAVANAVLRANDYGVAVVAAAGNDGGPVAYPAAYPTALSVGATDTREQTLCGFSNRGEGLRLLAPGCELDGADPLSGAGVFNYWEGTSESSVIAATALTALATYRPDLSPSAAEEALTSVSGANLNIAQAFRDAGLGWVVNAGEAAEPHAQSSLDPENPPPGMPTSTAMPLTARFARPLARLKRVRGGLVLVLRERPREAQVQVRVFGHRRHARSLSVLRTLRGTLTQLTLPRRLSAVSLRYVDPYDATRTSPWVTLRLPSAKSGAPKR